MKKTNMLCAIVVMGWAGVATAAPTDLLNTVNIYGVDQNRLPGAVVVLQSEHLINEPSIPVISKLHNKAPVNKIYDGNATALPIPPSSVEQSPTVPQNIVE
jgi:hypothetical protein